LGREHRERYLILRLLWKPPQIRSSRFGRSSNAAARADTAEGSETGKVRIF
jgi:hypothetical protein